MKTYLSKEHIVVKIDKKEFEKRKKALRTLLGVLVPPVLGNEYQKYSYRFGAAVDPSTALWHIYNLGSDNCIGTINLGTNKEPLKTTVVRYRNKSVYADVLKEYGGKGTVYVPSSNLYQRSNWLKKTLKQNILNTCGKKAAVTPGIDPSTAPERQAKRVRLGVDGRIRDERGRFLSPNELTPEQHSIVEGYNIRNRGLIARQPYTQGITNRLQAIRGNHALAQSRLDSIYVNQRYYQDVGSPGISFREIAELVSGNEIRSIRGVSPGNTIITDGAVIDYVRDANAGDS
jgi:hypothetical protein